MARGFSLRDYSLAAPSWVISASLAKNCVFLATRVNDVGLLFMESRACLEYGPEDLPPSLAALPLRYHVHLPVDLPMEESPEEAANICLALLRKTAFLAKEEGGRYLPHLRGVLHPPVENSSLPGKAADLLESFIHFFEAGGGDASLLFLENIKGNDLLSHFSLMRRHSMSICLDLGHALAYGHEKLLAEGSLPRMLGMLHLNAPGPASSPGTHQALSALDARGRETGASLCHMLAPGRTIMLELFSWPQIEESLPILHSWLRKSG